MHSNGLFLGYFWVFFKIEVLKFFLETKCTLSLSALWLFLHEGCVHSKLHYLYQNASFLWLDVANSCLVCSQPNAKCQFNLDGYDIPRPQPRSSTWLWYVETNWEIRSSSIARNITMSKVFLFELPFLSILCHVQQLLYCVSFRRTGCVPDFEVLGIAVSP